MDPLVPGTGFGSGATLHRHLGADVSGQDAFEDIRTGTQPHAVWSICRDRAGDPELRVLPLGVPSPSLNPHAVLPEREVPPLGTPSTP